MDTSMFWWAATISAICIGLGKGGVPVITALSVPILSLVISPIAAAGLLLPVFLAADAFGLYAYRRVFDRRVLGIMMAAMPVGVGIGWATAHLVSEAIVTLIIGLVGGSFALSALARRAHDGPPQPARLGPGLFWGTITGFTSFVSHSGGPPFQIYTLPLRLSKLAFAGTMTVAFAYINVIKLIPYYALGQLSLENLRVTLILMVPAVLAVFVGLRIVKITPEKVFFTFVIWALLAVSLRLIWQGISAL